MKDIEGVDIKAAYKDAKEQCDRDRHERVTRAISNQIRIREAAYAKLASLESECSKARSAVQRADETIKKIVAGDWSAIPEPKVES